MDIDIISKKLKDRVPQSIEPMAKFAVLLPLIKIGDQWELIFEFRAKTLKSQPGEVSFPGGKVEEGESFKETAIRETMEELHIKEENIHILGELDYLISYANLEIHCFLGTISGVNVDKISPNPSEVDHIFTVPLDYFLEVEPKAYYLSLETMYNEEFPYNLIPNGKDYNFRKPKRKIYFYECKDHIIWGYTATMIRHLVEILKDQ
ncbi:NUDIX hydrolase [Wansuia hejianensis]|uniref:CoA pyrophosphatase n=1 Tax=Wansuia hejianensis TaxID=2763667 RepID=A0A926F3C6_9FIRM|nr:CoA pyrophosphatase [Wansuia hejianensis]MBC8591217.1 CoA pyrophosphatase [Wansuia hejianensis]